MSITTENINAVEAATEALALVEELNGACLEDGVYQWPTPDAPIFTEHGEDIERLFGRLTDLERLGGLTKGRAGKLLNADTRTLFEKYLIPYSLLQNNFAPVRTIYQISCTQEKHPLLSSHLLKAVFDHINQIPDEQMRFGHAVDFVRLSIEFEDLVPMPSMLNAQLWEKAEETVARCPRVKSASKFSSHE